MENSIYLDLNDFNYFFRISSFPIRKNLHCDISEFDKGLRIATRVQWRAHIDYEHSSTLEYSAGSARTSKSKKEDVDHFSPDRLAMAAGKRNFSLPAGRTMPPRPANNYIVQWKITGLNILHVETEMPVPCRGFSNIGAILYL